METFVTADEVAEFLKCSRPQVLQLARTGKIPAHPFGFGKERKSWRFLLSQVREAVTAKNVFTSSAAPVMVNAGSLAER